MTVIEPPALIVTASQRSGRRSPVQFSGSCHETPSPPPSHAKGVPSALQSSVTLSPTARCRTRRASVAVVDPDWSLSQTQGRQEAEPTAALSEPRASVAAILPSWLKSPQIPWAATPAVPVSAPSAGGNSRRKIPWAESPARSRVRARKATRPLGLSAGRSSDARRAPVPPATRAPAATTRRRPPCADFKYIAVIRRPFAPCVPILSALRLLRRVLIRTVMSVSPPLRSSAERIFDTRKAPGKRRPRRSTSEAGDAGQASGGQEKTACVARPRDEASATTFAAKTAMPPASIESGPKNDW